MIRFFSLAVLALSLVCSSLFAQVTTGTISGTVQDSSGAVVPGAEVVINHVDTGNARNVTADSQGRYLVPDLPQATYSIWVRGYGLVDSARQTVERGRSLALTATPAPDEKTAAKVYPAIYWYSMMRIPDRKSTRLNSSH